MTRRGMLKRMFQWSLFVGLSQTLLSSLANAAAKCTGKLIDQKPINQDAVNQANILQYSSHVEMAIKAKKPGASKEKTCEKCNFYTSDGADCGKCLLINFDNIRVHNTGWCISWAPKAK